MEISQIRLNCVLPEVFACSGLCTSAPTSGIWLNDITLSRGNHYLIEAESGTGKSSLCSYIYGCRNDYRGTITMDGRDIRTFSIADWCGLRRRSLALLPQEMRLFPELTAEENVQIKNRLTHHLSESQVSDMFERMEIGDKAQTPVSRLSIGQQQRVAIIRALAQPIDFVLLDEPVSHLDARNNRIAAEMISEHVRAAGASIVTTSVGNPLLLNVDVNRITL